MTVQNIIAGVELDGIVFNAISEQDGSGQFKITHFGPVTEEDHHVANAGKLIDLIEHHGSNHTDGAAIMFICKMAVVISKLNDFKSHARKAIKDKRPTESDGTRSFKFYFSG